jgi:hypothetical protein
MPATRIARPEHLSPASCPTRRSRPEAPKQRDLVIASLLRCPDDGSDATTARAVLL